MTFFSFSLLYNSFGKLIKVEYKIKTMIKFIKELSKIAFRKGGLFILDLDKMEKVLDLLTQGITYKGVAQKLFISETTVKTHVNNIFQKLQVNDRTQAVLYAINNGFLSKKVKLSV